MQSAALKTSESPLPIAKKPARSTLYLFGDSANAREIQLFKGPEPAAAKDWIARKEKAGA
jgi:hypothetical protein